MIHAESRPRRGPQMSSIPDSRLADPKGQLITDLQRQLAECRAERDAALARETAIAEVLQVTNSSAGDLAPVFNVLLNKALALCGAAYGSLVIWDGERSHVAAGCGRQEFQAPAASSIMRRLRDGEDVVHIDDIATEAAYQAGIDDPVRCDLVDTCGFHTLLSIALRKENLFLGAIHVYRQEIRSFTHNEIMLLQNFAAQAVIAMENARLINEIHDALEQQPATAEVLQVINSSPGDLAPVFDAMLE